MATQTIKKTTATKTTTARKTTPKKTTTKVEPTIVETVKEEVKEPVVEKVVEKKIVRKFEPTDLIVCRSVTAGGLIMKGKRTNTTYVWGGFGDVAEIEYQDLQHAKISKSRFIYDPLFIIEDTELLSQWTDVQDGYNAMYTDADIEQLFYMDLESFKRTLEGMPVGVQNSVKSIAVEKIENGTFDSIQKIKAMDVILGTDLITYIS